jgi:hypothetical protein
MPEKWVFAHSGTSGPGSQGHPNEGKRMTEHDVITTDLAPSDVEAEQITGGAPLVLDLGALGRITIGIPALGL